MMYTMPPTAEIPPPRTVARYLYFPTSIPAASAVAGDSPTARRYSPGRVRSSHRPMATASATPRYTNTL